MASGTTIGSVPAAYSSVNTSFKPRIVNVGGDSVKVIGEDYVATTSPLNSANTTWATIAGFPLSPYSMGNNAMADMCRTYKEWRFEQVAFCYVPAVGTTSSGQVALYRKMNRADPHIDPNNPQFYNYVLSQNTGVVGTVWQPMSFVAETSKDWRSCVPLEAVDINEEADGEVFIATNNSVASGVAPSVGIIKMQYVCSFRGFSRNPRLSLIPCANQVYLNTSVGRSTFNSVNGSSAHLNPFGSDQAGVSHTGLIPSGVIKGDCFKFIVDLGRSSFSGFSGSTLFAESVAGIQVSFSLENGSVIYLWFDGTNTYSVHKNIQSVMTGSQFVFGATLVGAQFNLVGMMSRVGNTNAAHSFDI